MADLLVKKGSAAKLDRVDGDLHVSKGARITAADGTLVVVSGAANFESDAEVDCGLDCGSLVVERGLLKVTGNLTVKNMVEVAHTVRVGGKISAQAIEVGGKMYAGSVLCGGPIRVGGIVEVTETLEAQSVDVGGKVLVQGAVKLRDFGVGGKAEVGGGSISGLVNVKGAFESSGPLEFGEMQVYGKCSLPPGCKGKRVSTFGKLSVGGPLSCEEIVVEGVTDVGGNCSAGKILVNGRLEVDGALAVEGALESNGSGEIRDEVTATDLRVGGRFRARKILLANQADIAGQLETQQGMKAKTVTVRSGTRCRGPIVGERVELGKSYLSLVSFDKSLAGQRMSAHAIGRMTQVEDVYAREVVLGKHSRCRRIFAAKVEVGDGCTVEQVVYTEELKGGAKGHAFFARPPEKVTSLPPFPL